MDAFEKDEVQMRSASISIPMNSMDSCEIENNFVGHTTTPKEQKFHLNVLYGWARRTFSSLHPYVSGVMKPCDKIVQQYWNKFFVISCLVAVFLDPLFVFMFYVNQDCKCIRINRTMKTVFVVFRSMTDFIYLLHMLLQFRLAPESRVVGSGDLVDHPKRIFLIDVFVVLPLPQILILLILPKFMTSSGANYAKNFLRAAILIQYIPRLYRVLPMLAGQSASGFVFESGWANFVINLLMFVLSGHVVGSCWYLFGFQRVNQCLRHACHVSAIDKICTRFIDCGQGNEFERFNDSPSWETWKNNVNASACFSDRGDFEYGIYAQAVHLTTKSSLITRYVYSLFWGFQVSSMIS